MRERDTTNPQSRYRQQQFPVLNKSNTLNTIGSQAFGKASATVFYKEGQSQWGLLDQKPAAVLEFHTDPFEPHGYKLRSLEVKITCSDYAEPGTVSRDSVRIMRRPSPANIKGGQITQAIEQNLNLNPQIPTPVGNAGIGGYEQKTTFERKAYWTYESHLDASQSTAIWLWNANDANSAKEETGDLHGGLVIAYNDDFFISCRIEGKLIRWTSEISQIARRWFKIRSTNEHGPSLRVTPRSTQLDLRQAAEELEQRMQTLMKQSCASYL